MSATLAPRDLLSLSELPAGLVIRSPDLLRPNRLINKLKSQFSIIEVERHSCTQLTAEKLAHIIDDAASVSLFAARRFVILSDAEHLPKALESALAQALGHVAPGVHIVLVLRNPTAKSTLSQIIAKQKNPGWTSVEFEALTGAKLQQWILKELTQQGLSNIPTTLASAFERLAGSDLDSLSRTTAQFADYCGTDTPTMAHFHQLFQILEEDDEFELVDSIVAGKLRNAEELSARLMDQGKSPFVLVAIIGRVFSNYAAIRDGVAHKLSDDVIRQRLSITPWVYQRSKAAALKYKPHASGRHLSAIVRADSLLKNKSLGAQPIVSELLEALIP